jgi:hypothetical protein
LKKRFGIDPPENDILWAIYNKQRTKYFLSQDFGHYRNTTLAMAQILYKESRLRHALEMYCEVFYIDLNGPQNLGGTSPEILKKFPPFDPDGFIVPRMVEHIEILAEKNNLGTDELKTIFIDHNRVVEKSLETPLSPAKLGKCLKRNLAKPNRAYFAYPKSVTGLSLPPPSASTVHKWVFPSIPIIISATDTEAGSLTIETLLPIGTVSLEENRLKIAIEPGLVGVCAGGAGDAVTADRVDDTIWDLLYGGTPDVRASAAVL